jgi:uncharacterized protein (TIGR03032 family)
MSASPQFPAWLCEQQLSLALTTYQIGKLFLIGLKPDGQLSIVERGFNRCMGLCSTANGLYLSSLYQVWRFENVFTAGEQQDGYDRLHVPQVGYTTGDLDIHDLAVDADGRLVFVNTLFGCLATLSETHSFRPLWRPPFLSRLAAEDRCHLNGLAIRDARPAYVTSVSASEVATGETLVAGLSMPHSSRWYRDRLWLLSSGTGEFGHVDREAGRFVPLTFCAGYLRGLAFHGDFALVGLSKTAPQPGLQRPAARRAPRQSPGRGAGYRAVHRPAQRRHSALAALRGDRRRTPRRRHPAGRAPADGARLRDRGDPAGAEHRRVGPGSRRKTTSAAAGGSVDKGRYGSKGFLYDSVALCIISLVAP